jgi:cobalt/nickel transport system permease protein
MTMHVQDSVLSPTVCAVAGAISAGAVGYSLHRLRDELGTRTIPLTGMMASLIFAAQMVNFPLFVLPVSGHLMGGVLAAVVLGPWAGLIALTLVLVVQCLLFADGGLLALGVNILHMGVMGAWGGYAVYRVVSGWFRTERTGLLCGTAIAAWVSVVAASFLFSLEFWFSWSGSNFDFVRIFALMVAFHSLIGIGEALISVGVLKQIHDLRPDLIFSLRSVPREPRLAWGRFATAICVATLAIAAFVAPFASASPDGLDAVGERTAFEELGQPPRVALLENYAVPPPVASWKETRWWKFLSVSLAGIGGVLAILGISWGVTRATRRIGPEAAS